MTFTNEEIEQLEGIFRRILNEEIGTNPHDKNEKLYPYMERRFDSLCNRADNWFVTLGKTWEAGRKITNERIGMLEKHYPISEEDREIIRNKEAELQEKYLNLGFLY